MAVIDTRYTMETSDGALIYVRNRGFRHGPPEVLRRIAAGEDVDPSLYYMRTTPALETGDPRYAWLNRIVCVASGAPRRRGRNRSVRGGMIIGLVSISDRASAGVYKDEGIPSSRIGSNRRSPLRNGAKSCGSSPTSSRSSRLR